MARIGITLSDSTKPPYFYSSI